MDNRRRSAIGIARVVGWLVSLLTIVFVVRLVLKSDISADDLVNIRWPLIGLSIVLLQVWYLIRAFMWSKLLGTGGWHWVGIRRWIGSELLRYLPGNVWSFVGRYQGAKADGRTGRRAWSTILFEVWILLSGAMAVSVFTTLPSPWDLGIRLGLAGTLLYPLLTFARPGLFPMPLSSAYGYFFLSAVNWSIYGLAMAILVKSLPGFPPIHLVTLIGANVAAWLLGYLSIITPMGLGVREVAFIRLLGASSVAEGVAALAASTTRVALIVSELIFFCWINLKARRSRELE